MRLNKILRPECAKQTVTVAIAHTPIANDKTGGRHKSR